MKKFWALIDTVSKNLARRRREISIGVVVIAMLLGYAFSEPSQSQQTPDDSKAERCAKGQHAERTLIKLQSGGEHEFDLAIVNTPVDIQIGLMFCKKMGKDNGMMFLLGPEEKPTAFWMKNTYIPLDMLFVDSFGKIVHIHRNAVPHSTESIPSVKPVVSVIEINGGRADELGIKIGDEVRHRYFRGPQPPEKQQEIEEPK